MSEQPLQYSFDTTEAYASPILVRNPSLYGSAEGLPKRESLNPIQTSCLALEEARFGISYESDPQGFLDAHNKSALDFQEHSQGVFDELAPSLVDRLSQHLSETIPGETPWPQVIGERVGRVEKVIVTDYLKSVMLADFRGMSNTMHVGNIWTVLDASTVDNLFKNVVLPHELLHAASAQGVLEGGLQNDFYTMNLLVRQGLEVKYTGDTAVPRFDPAYGHGEWVNEAGIETLRAQMFSAENDVHAYATLVPILRALYEVNPSLQADVEGALFGSTTPAVVFGKIETMIGPLGIDAIESVRQKGTQGIANLPAQISDMKAAVTQLVTAEYRPALVPALESNFANVAPIDIEKALRSAA